MKIALIGAGGKMGVRLANNLKSSRYDVAYVEVSEAGRARLKDATGADCVPLEAALSGAGGGGAGGAGHRDRKGRRRHRAEGRCRAPSSSILDAAAPYAGHLPERADITYFVTHPCHPPIFNDEVDAEAPQRPLRRHRRASRRS